MCWSKNTSDYKINTFSYSPMALNQAEKYSISILFWGSQILHQRILAEYCSLQVDALE